MPNQHADRRQSEQRRKYLTPQLTYFGAIRQLTQAGGSGPSENNSPGGCMDVARKDNPGCPPSDRRVKEHIIRIGSHPLFGFGLYLFNYKPKFRDQHGHTRQFGVMADEVITVVPKAVHTHPDGYQRVNYELLGIIRSAH